MKDHKGVFISKIDGSFTDFFGLVPVIVQGMADVSGLEYNEILDDLKVTTEQQQNEDNSINKKEEEDK